MKKYIAQQMTIKARRLLDKLCKKSMRSRPKELEHVLVQATQEKKIGVSFRGFNIFFKASFPSILMSSHSSLV